MSGVLARGEAGMTLVEVLVALAIVAVALVPALDVFYSGHLITRGAGEDSDLSGLAQEKMEQALALPWPALDDEGPAAYPGRPGYSYRVEVSDFDTQLGLKQVTVTVYRDAEPAKGLSLTTLTAGM